MVRQPRTALALGLVLLAATTLWGPPAEGQKTKLPSGSFELKRTTVPPAVFSIAGEVMAYRATGEPGEVGEARISVQNLRARVGGFSHVTVYEVSEKTVLGSQRLEVDPSGVVSFSGTAGNTYLLYAELGERHQNGYRVLCRFRQAGFKPERSSHICTRIFCTADVFPASELIVRSPELAKTFKRGDFPDGLIGGLGGGGGICEECFGAPEIFYPVGGCDDKIPLPDPPPDGSREDVVFVFKPYPFDAPTGNSQIYKMHSDGTNRVNLSNNNHDDFRPDVHHTLAKIVFTSSRPGADRLYIMDINGGNVAAIPNTPAAGYPRWSRGAERFVVFTHPPNGWNSAIYRIRVDGSDRVRITDPGPDEADEIADVLEDDEFILFSRMDRSNNNDRDLYTKYVWDNRPVRRLTDTPDRSEGLPVVSHDGRMFAYRVVLGAGQDDQVHVANLANGELNVLHVIDLNRPATRNITGIDFSNDDRWLYISTRADDAPGGELRRFQEVFRVRLDGSDQQRLTVNDDVDEYPSAVPPAVAVRKH